MTSPHPPAAADASLSMERANVIGAALFPVAAAAVLVPFGVVWGWGEVWAGALAVFTPWVFVPAFVLAIVAHEGLHALGFLLFARVPRGALHFGIHRQTLTPFAGCRVPVPAVAYRAAVALPGLVLGAVPAAAGLAYGAGWAAVWGALMLATAAGDALVLWVIRRLPGSTRVLDHPERVGCLVLDEPPPPATLLDP